MKKKWLLGVILAVSLAFVACGDKKVDTGKVDTGVKQEEKEEDTIPPYVEDDCITVIDEVEITNKEGKVTYKEQYTYNEDGSPKGIHQCYLDSETDAEIETDFVWVYNDYGFPCNLVDVNDDTNYARRTATDSLGLTAYLSSEDEVEYNSNGEFVKVVGPSGSIDYTYDNGKIQKIEDKKGSLEIITEYTYLGDEIGTKTITVFDVASGRVTDKTVYTYQGKAYTYESYQYLASGGTASEISKYDDSGMCTSYEYSYINSEKTVLSGTYNDRKTLYSLVNEETYSKVYGYQVKMSSDGRPITIYKIDSEGNRLNDDFIGFMTYDEYGHLDSLVKNDYMGAVKAESTYSDTTIFQFKRVPKKAYKESMYYSYENIVDINSLFSLTNLTFDM